MLLTVLCCLCVLCLCRLRHPPKRRLKANRPHNHLKTGLGFDSAYMTDDTYTVTAAHSLHDALLAHNRVGLPLL